MFSREDGDFLPNVIGNIKDLALEKVPDKVATRLEENRTTQAHTTLSFDRECFVLYNVYMEKSNAYRKLYPMDRFAKRYYCKHAKRNQILSDKSILRKKVRMHGKQIIRKESLQYESQG